MKYVSPVVAASSNVGGQKYSSRKCLYKITVSHSKAATYSGSKCFKLCCMWKCGYDVGDRVSGKDLKGMCVCITQTNSPGSAC